MSTGVFARSRPWVVPVGLVTLCFGLSLAGPAWRDTLAYTRDGLSAGRLWQLASGHLVHVDGSHATLNLVALLLVAWIFSADLDRWTAQVVVLAGGAIAIDAALWTLHPEVTRYVGLSGLLHAWFAAGATLWVARAFDGPRDPARLVWGLVLLVGLAAKLAIEAHDAAFWRAGLDLPVVTAAHRWGALGGVCAGVLIALGRARRRA